ncbi:MAG: cytochrome P450 [Verrucomicrobiales bacterium]
MKKAPRNRPAMGPAMMPSLTRRHFVHHAFAGVALLSAGHVFARNSQPWQQLRKSRNKKSDSIMALLREGYLFIPNRCRSLNSDVFETRLMSKDVICLSGYEGAKLFYDDDLFERKNAAPKRLQKSLTGENGVQSLDGAAHKHRKAMFMSLMTQDKLDRFVGILNVQLRNAGLLWTKKGKVTLFSEAEEILFRTSCEWSGVPLQDSEAAKRARDMGKMVDGLGSIGCRNYRGRFARNRSEAWMVDIINRVRQHELAAPEGRALHTMAWHKDLNGQLLDAEVAAVDMLNIVRPITAIDTYIAFMASALHQHPQYRASLQRGNDGDYQAFVQEVRRFYPFTPFIIAKVRKDFSWKGHHFPQGRSVLLSAYGVDHDPKLWNQPEQFHPERFKSWGGDKFDFIPHGGGDYYDGHRCAGEQLTIQAMKTTLEFLVKDIDYDVPPQDLKFSMSRIPTFPNSGFVMNNVALRRGAQID